MHLAYVLALACGALAAPTRRYPTQLRLTLPAPDAPLIGASSSSPSSSSSSLSISSLLSAAADAAQSLAPSWLPYSSSSASASGNEEELEWSVVDDTPSDDDDSDDIDDGDLLDNTEDDEALLDAWLAEVAEWEDTHQPCIEACRVRVVPGAQDAEEALCSAVGLASALECAQCIDAQWTPTADEEGAMAEYARIRDSCRA